MFIFNMIFEVIGDSIKVFLRERAYKALTLILFFNSFRFLSLFPEIVNKDGDKYSPYNEIL